MRRVQIQPTVHMLPPENSPSAPQSRDLIDNPTVLAEIRRSALVFHQRPSGEPGATDSATCWRVTVGGAQLQFRCRVLTGPHPAVVVVMIEQCARSSDHAAHGRMIQALGLTTRELEVAQLLAGRRSNREIAVHLGVTEHTARRHTERVLQKLGVCRRGAVERIIAAAPPTARAVPAPPSRRSPPAARSRRATAGSAPPAAPRSPSRAGCRPGGTCASPSNRRRAPSSPAGR